MPRPIAQQMNPEGNVDESLLPRKPASWFNVSSWPSENRFYTAWTQSGHLRAELTLCQEQELATVVGGLVCGGER